MYRWCLSQYNTIEQYNNGSIILSSNIKNLITKYDKLNIFITSIKYSFMSLGDYLLDESTTSIYTIRVNPL